MRPRRQVTESLDEHQILHRVSTPVSSDRLICSVFRSVSVPNRHWTKL